MRVAEGRLVADIVNIPVVVLPSGLQLVTGVAVVPQQVPRAVRVAPPLEVTLAPKVALLKVMEVAVGEVTVGGRAPVVNVPSAE